MTYDYFYVNSEILSASNEEWLCWYSFTVPAGQVLNFEGKVEAGITDELNLKLVAKEDAGDN